jgi:alpha-galactosidase
MTGYSSSATVPVAAIGDTLAGAPAAVAGSMEQSKKMMDQWAAIQDLDETRKLDDLKRQAEFATKQLELLKAQRDLAALGETVMLPDSEETTHAPS